MLSCECCRRQVDVTYHLVVEGEFKNYCWLCKHKNENEKEVVDLKYTRHHLIPRSRIRKSKQTVMLPEKFHDAWHHIFGDLKPAEIVFFVREINRMMYDQKTLTARAIQEIREDIKEISPT